jgi:hypothetical protein
MEGKCLGTHSHAANTWTEAVGPSNGRSENADLMAASLGIYGRADASSALDPLGRSLLAAEKRQDKQQGKSTH